MHTQHFRGQRIISEQVGPSELAVVWRELERVLAAGVPGDVVEFGCYEGTTSLFIRRLLDERGESGRREFHAYDSFEGLPQKGREDASPTGAQFQPGELRASKKALLRHFRAAGLAPPVVHTGWFGELEGRDVPPRIAFAFLDGDFYDSIMASLKLVWPRLSPGGVVLIDDYGREALPGVKRAARDFFQHKPMQLLRIEAQIAVVQSTASLPKSPGS